MNKKRPVHFFTVAFLLSLAMAACNNGHKTPGEEIVASPQELTQRAAELVHTMTEEAARSEGLAADSFRLRNVTAVTDLYQSHPGALLWSNLGNWLSPGMQLKDAIDASRLYGLFPSDYHQPMLDSIFQQIKDDSTGKSARLDAVKWAKADLALSDAFVQMIKDVKLGRLPSDSVTLRKDSVIAGDFFGTAFNALAKGEKVTDLFNSLEPKLTGYQQLKAALPQFLAHANPKTLTRVPGPRDAGYRQALQKRLFEGGYISFDSIPADSVQLAAAVKRFQKEQDIVVDGKAGEGTIRLLNLDDHDRFVRIAITMDRYKLLPAELPERYIWVNLPSFYMKLVDHDTVKLISRIVCGKPLTRTPLLTSAVSEIITYPQWTIPTSIIVKEILPAAKRNPGYFAKKGFSLVDGKGDEVDPYSVDWSKYSKGIPYRVVQGSGDANALGVLKFNFPNKYAVYLHDTNQRYLFGQPVRSFSHGCVRVQEWQKLASYIIRTDAKDPGAAHIPMMDSLNNWLARKEKHSIGIRKRVPVFIRYFTCEAGRDGISFYDDIYGEDRQLAARYFAGK